MKRPFRINGAVSYSHIDYRREDWRCEDTKMIGHGEFLTEVKNSIIECPKCGNKDEMCVEEHEKNLLNTTGLVMRE